MITPIQERAIGLLLSGTTVAAAARELGIDRTTIYTWRKSHPEFSRAFNRARALQSEILRDNLHEIASEAVGILHELLVSGSTPPSARLRAALAVLNAATLPSTHKSADPTPQNSTEFDTLPNSPQIQWTPPKEKEVSNGSLDSALAEQLGAERKRKEDRTTGA
jgi:transposase-like protein